MNTTERWMGFEFRYRIFVSLGIVLLACTVSYGFYADQRTVPEIMLGPDGRTIGFGAASLLCLLASLLRMAGGTALRSGRVMSFAVRPETLVLVPPYNLVRNPIYLADLIAASGFSLCMPLPGLMFPLLLLLHYRNLVAYEEGQLAENHGQAFEHFLSSVPALLPTPSSILAFMKRSSACRVDHDGRRYNALYVLFIPGLWISAITGSFFHAVVIGLPAVADWAYWHTIKGLQTNQTEVYHES